MNKNFVIITSVAFRVAISKILPSVRFFGIYHGRCQFFASIADISAIQEIEFELPFFHYEVRPRL